MPRLQRGPLVLSRDDRNSSEWSQGVNCLCVRRVGWQLRQVPTWHFKCATCKLARTLNRYPMLWYLRGLRRQWAEHHHKQAAENQTRHTFHILHENGMKFSIMTGFVPSAIPGCRPLMGASAGAARQAFSDGRVPGIEPVDWAARAQPYATSPQC